MIKLATFLTLITSAIASAEPPTFRNPINPSADPWLGYTEGRYHLSTTLGNRIQLWSADTIAGLRDARPVTILAKGKGVWAAEFHHLQGSAGRRWYCYFTRTDGADIDHRMFVMESTTESITGPYREPRRILTDPKDEYYAIDGSVFEDKGRCYFVWAGHPGHRLYMARMKDPFTLDGERVMIPASGFGCKEVREGPCVIRHGPRLFLTYSACDTGKPDYKVGYLWMPQDADPIKPDSWIQHPEPLLSRNDAAEVYGPGHHSFFKSPDGKEDWIAYHAKTTVAFTYSGRTSRVEKLDWNDDGLPQTVIPLPLTADIHPPSGEGK